jgi:hypothetical protein
MMTKNKNKKENGESHRVDEEILKKLEKVPNKKPGIPGGISLNNTGKPLIIVSTEHV